MRELHHALLVAALRHDDAHLAVRLLRQPVFEQLLLGRRHRHVDLRRRILIGVELLNRGLDRRPASRLLSPLSAASQTNSTRSITRPPRTMNTCTTAPLAPTLTPNTSRSPSSADAIFCCRSRTASHRAHRVAQLRRFLEALGPPMPRACAPRSCSASSWLRPSRNSFVSATATA